ncbi:MAG: hypothetical protein ACRC4L_03380 [Mycoplasma sp.]
MKNIIFTDFEFYSKDDKKILMEISAFTNTNNGVECVFKGYYDPCIDDQYIKYYLTMNKYNPELSYDSETELYYAFYEVSKKYDETYVYGDADQEALKRVFENNAITETDKIELKDFQLELRIGDCFITNEPIRLSTYANILEIKAIDNCSKSESDAHLLINIFNQKDMILNDAEIKSKLWIERIRPTLSYDYNNMEYDNLQIPKINKDFKVVYISFRKTLKITTLLNEPVQIFKNGVLEEQNFNDVNFSDLVDNSIFIVNSWDKLNKYLLTQNCKNKIFYKISSNNQFILNLARANTSHFKEMSNPEKNDFSKFLDFEKTNFKII